MKTENLNGLVQCIRSLGTSDEFIKGALFLLGGVLMKANADEPIEKLQAAMQWVVPQDINAVSEDILGRMYDGLIGQIVEEFLFKIGSDVPMRKIQIDSYSTQLCTPADHGVLASVNYPADSMQQISKIYFSMAEEIGVQLKKSAYSYAESFQAGICFFNSWLQIDVKATAHIINLLSSLAPPALMLCFSAPKIRGLNPSEWLPTQVALWGVVTGLDETFMHYAWPYQSWILYKDQQPIPGVEDLSPIDFFSHVKKISAEYFLENKFKIQSLVNLNIGSEKISEWTNDGVDIAQFFDVIQQSFGYDPARLRTH
jgi:hypothetical protein